MKKLIPLSITIISVLHVLSMLAQKDCQDAVHPTENQISIANCCIRSIKDGNIVTYVKYGEVSERAAVAVFYRGIYYDLTDMESNSRFTNTLFKNYPEGKYINEEYEYYRKKYNQATTNIVVGAVMAVTGTGMFVGGIIIMNSKLQEWPETNGNGAGFFLMLGGAGLMGTGIPISVRGSRNKARYREAMDEEYRQAKLSLQTNSYGVALVLNF